MRLFIGLEPTPDFRAALSELQTRLRAAGIVGRFLLPENLHMTLAFIGEWPEDVTDALPVVTEPFSIRLSRPGIFPKAKVLWAGVEPSRELYALATDVRKRLDILAVPYDRQAFNPHITLIRKPILPSAETLASIQTVSATMIVREVCLYQSVHEAEGMKYTVIGRSKIQGSEHELNQQHIGYRARENAQQGIALPGLKEDDEKPRDQLRHTEGR